MTPARLMLLLIMMLSVLTGQPGAHGEAGCAVSYCHATSQGENHEGDAACGVSHHEHRQHPCIHLTEGDTLMNAPELKKYTPSELPPAPVMLATEPRSIAKSASAYSSRLIAPAVGLCLPMLC